MKDVMVERTSEATTYTGSGLAVVGGMTVNEFVAFAGLALGIAGFAINWFYRHKTYQHQKSIAEKNAGPSEAS